MASADESHVAICRPANNAVFAGAQKDHKMGGGGESGGTTGVPADMRSSLAFRWNGSLRRSEGQKDEEDLCRSNVDG